MITSNAQSAIAAYNSTASLVDEDRIINDLRDQLTELLVKPTFCDMTAANKVLSEALGEKSGVITFIGEELLDLHSSLAIARIDEYKRQLLSKIAILNAHLNSIIQHATTHDQATALAVSISGYYRDAIIKHAIAEQREDDYSTATQDIQL